MTTTRTHIAHGAFRLWHTFSSENLYTAQQGTTRNLMDYNGTNSELYKYQWDYIHNPQEGIVRWLVDDDEGELAVQIVQCLTAAAIDVAANNAFKWVELWYNGTPADITDYETIFGAILLLQALHVQQVSFPFLH